MELASLSKAQLYITWGRVEADLSERTDVGSDYENPTGGNLANGHIVNALEEKRLFLERHSMMGDICANGDKWKLSTIGLSVLLLIAIIINIHLLAKPHPAPTAPGPPDASSPSSDASPCPQRWVMNDGWYYLFSDTEETWNASQIACSSLGGSLVAMDTPQEWDFVSQSKRPRYYWIGLWRAEAGELWKWANGSLFNDRFPVGGKGLCAYLNKDQVSSTWCDNQRYWICRKASTWEHVKDILSPDEGTHPQRKDM